MADKRAPKVTAEAEIGPDVDLATEVVRDTEGRRIDEAYAERLVEAGRRIGRPSLTGKAEASPSVAFRLAPELRAKAEAVAAREGKTVSALAREALEERLRAS